MKSMRRPPFAMTVASVSLGFTTSASIAAAHPLSATWSGVSLKSASQMNWSLPFLVAFWMASACSWFPPFLEYPPKIMISPSFSAKRVPTRSRVDDFHTPFFRASLSRGAVLSPTLFATTTPPYVPVALSGDFVAVEIVHSQPVARR